MATLNSGGRDGFSEEVTLRRDPREKEAEEEHSTHWGWQVQRLRSRCKPGTLEKYREVPLRPE